MVFGATGEHILMEGMTMRTKSNNYSPETKLNSII